jgi:hypothetical protein
MVALFLLPVSSLAAENFGTIHGSVRDSGGRGVSGALVVIAPAVPSSIGRVALTDPYGAFTVERLTAGDYVVQASRARFFPSEKERVQLGSGAIERVSMSLQTALDVVRKAVSLDAKDAREVVPWTLRASRSTQPVLRFSDDHSGPVVRGLWSAYSGYFQFYSRSDASSRTSDTVGSRFSVTLDLLSDSRVTFSGQYNESPIQPKGASALYEFTPASGHRTQIGMNIRQGVILDEAFTVEELKEFQVKYTDKFQLHNRISLEHGAEIGYAEAAAVHKYFRPKAALSWVPNQRTVFTVAASTQSSGQTDDPIRGRDYFEQVSLPPAFERNLHTELGASRILSDEMKISAAVFQDEAAYRALFVSAPDGRHGLLIYDAKPVPSRGVRIHLNREFHGFEAGFGFTTATGPGLSPTASTLDEVRSQIQKRQFHVITARVKTDFNLTNTELTAVYRWISDYAAGAIDPYQQVVEYNDPTLSISVAQNLPPLGPFPAKVQAIVDARNLFEQSFGPPGAQLAHSPRFLRGGINIRF